MNIKSRKFIAWVVVMAVLTGLAVLVILKASDQFAASIPWFTGGYLFVTAAYIGGNVWSAYVKSKYFRDELKEGDK
jgi:hypothetical protein